MSKIDVRNHFFYVDGQVGDYVGEAVRCLSCGAVTMAEEPGDGCVGPFAVYSYRHTEDDEGTELHRDHLSRRIEALERVAEAARKMRRYVPADDFPTAADDVLEYPAAAVTGLLSALDALDAEEAET